MDKKKPKHSRRNYRKIAFRIMLIGLMLFLLWISVPTLYLWLTYYDLPEVYEKPLTSDWHLLQDEPYRLCVEIGFLGGYWTISDSLKIRIVIDGEMVPLQSIQTIDNPYSFDSLFPSFDVTCTTQPELAFGEHEVIVWKNNFSSYSGYGMRWKPLRRWVIYVDESGFIH